MPSISVTTMQVRRLPRQSNHEHSPLIGEASSLDEACELARQDSRTRNQFARYEVKHEDGTSALLVTHRFPSGWQAMVTYDPMSPRFTDEEVMARFADPVEAV